MTFYNELQPKIIQDILNERNRQHKKWGKQNFPFLGNVHDGESYRARRNILQELYDDIDSKRSEIYTQHGWDHILLEEVYEALSETDLEKQRIELVQTAAVAVQIIEWIDRTKA